MSAVSLLSLPLLALLRRMGKARGLRYDDSAGASWNV